MKRIALLIAVLMLGGCAKPPTQVSGDNTAATIDGCRAYYQKQLELENAQYYTIPEGQRALVLSNRDTMRMIEKTFGKYEDPCQPGTNYYDAYIAYVKEHNETLRHISEDGFGFAKHGSTVLGAVKAVGDIADKVGDNIQGNKVTAGHDAITAEGDISIADTQHNEEKLEVQQIANADEDVTISPAITKEETVAPIEAEEVVEE